MAAFLIFSEPTEPLISCPAPMVFSASLEPVMEPAASCREEILTSSRVSAAVPRVMAVYFCSRQS